MIQKGVSREEQGQQIQELMTEMHQKFNELFPLKKGSEEEESQLNGEAWITLTPHFYPTSKLTLDAKSFNSVSSASSEITTPLPIIEVTLSRRIPDGIK